MYVKHFPLEDEQESFDVWESLLKRGKHIYIAFGKDFDSSNPKIMGFVVAGLYDNSALVEYIIREKKYTLVLRGTEI